MVPFFIEFVKKLHFYYIIKQYISSFVGGLFMNNKFMLLVFIFIPAYSIEEEKSNFGFHIFENQNVQIEPSYEAPEGVDIESFWDASR